MRRSRAVATPTNRRRASKTNKAIAVVAPFGAVAFFDFASGDSVTDDPTRSEAARVTQPNTQRTARIYIYTQLSAPARSGRCRQQTSSIKQRVVLCKPSSVDLPSMAETAAASAAVRRVVFALNGQRYEVAGADPSTRLLEFIRTKTPFKGTKLGCGEGNTLPFSGREPACNPNYCIIANCGVQQVHICMHYCVVFGHYWCTLISALDCKS